MSMTLPSLHLPIRLALSLPVPDRVALVVHLLALDQRDLRLGARALEIERQGHARHPPRRHGAGPAVELPAMKEELAVAFGKVVRPGPGPVRGDVRPDQEGLAV